MSSSVLEKLKVKPIPKIQDLTCKSNDDSSIVINTTINDKTKKNLINRDEFIAKLNIPIKIKASTPVQIKITEPSSDVVPIVKKTKKISKKLKLIPDKDAEETTAIKPGKRKTKQPELQVIADDIDLQLTINDSKLSDRLPIKDKKVLYRANAYYMNNRESFISFINKLFKPYKEEFESAQSTISCDKASDAKFSLLTHQKLVRDYLNIYSPYRGLLLYHGLGSGKTCSSIAIAEGMKTDKQIIVMTPASLRMNYLQELKSCGDDIYKTNQFWEFINIGSKSNPNQSLVSTLSSVLSISSDYIIKHGGAWLVNVKKSSNFEDLSSEEKKSLDLQINEMITNKYRFINYNGLRNSHLKDLTRDYTINPFDNKVVIVDEAHNLVSRIVNKLKRPDALSMRLYQYLMSADNCKIVLLSGTPIINYPNEIAILFNILRGYIKTWSFPLNINTSKKINKTEMINIFKGLDVLDYLDYKPASKVLTVTRNPFGFIDVNKDGTYKGVTNFKVKNRGNVSDDDFVKFITAILKKEQIDVITNNIKVEYYKALPDNIESFEGFFIDSNKKLKNESLLKKRILGLTSYFKSAQEKLMPAFNKITDFKVIKIPMSDYQFGVYEQARIAERKLEKANKKRKPASNDDLYKDSVSTYRIFSRAFCNFVFPIEFPRPMPDKDNTIEDIEESMDEDILDAVPVSEKIANPDGLYDLEDVDIIDKDIKNKQDDTYDERIKQALQFLKDNSSKYLTSSGLQTYSPKFLHILENIMDPEFKGLHLIYSQFRTIEGIGILKLILEANGFAQFKIKKNEAGIWNLNISEKDKGKPTFALYTGTEDAEEKEIIRNIFNSDWTKVPDSITRDILPISTNNHYGEIIKVLSITASGAEGISLKNTRYVHIVEPYWHPVRGQQVIGRAKRICSHQALPPELRTVNVFLYLMTFTPEQTEGENAMEMKLYDTSKFDDSKPITSDEALHEISTIKEKITEQILNSVKESSMDCAIYNKPGNKDGVKCFSFGKANPNSFSYKPSITNEESDSVSGINRETTLFKPTEIKLPIDGKMVTFALDKTTNEVYEMSSYNEAKEFGTDIEPIGKIVYKDNGKAKFVKTKV
jgi:hypothetical protein